MKFVHKVKICFKHLLNSPHEGVPFAEPYHFIFFAFVSFGLMISFFCCRYLATSWFLKISIDLIQVVIK